MGRTPTSAAGRGGSPPAAVRVTQKMRLARQTWPLGATRSDYSPSVVRSFDSPQLARSSILLLDGMPAIYLAG